jgi:hypothetical protein
MCDSHRLLELIETCIAKHGGDLGGWTLRTDGTLRLFDGRVTLRAELREGGTPALDGVVHAHVFATLHEHDDELLDACVIGVGDDRDPALGQAAAIWMTGVAGPIKSFLDNKPVCMTCQAGVTGGDISNGFCESDFGLPGLRAFVGPSISRGFSDDRIPSAIDETKPWFRFAAESAAPRRVHLAKATITSSGKDGWRRELEVDGHDVSHHDPDWPAGVKTTECGYLTRFAVFEFPRNSQEIARRARLEQAIRHFAENFQKFETADQLMEEMVRRGFDPELVHETEAISTIAFGRTLLEPHGVQYPSTVIRARRDGRIEPDVPLMSIPAYSRARALAAKLGETMPKEQFQALCFYTAESQAILKAMESLGDKLDLTTLTMYPCVVPDYGVSQQTMDAALAMLNRLVEQQRAAKK